MDIIINMLLFLLHGIHGFVGDWGITVMSLTIVVRLALLPLSLKQKASLQKQTDMFKQISEVKEKFKNQKSKMEEEVTRITKENSKTMLGCMSIFLQIPIFWSLYTTFARLPESATSIFIPWVSSLKIPDPYLIIPILTVVIQLAPGLLAHITIMQRLFPQKATFIQIVISIAIASLFIVKMSVAVGVYYLFSGLFGIIEQILFALIYGKSKKIMAVTN